MIPEPEPDEPNTGGLTADQLMLKIQEEEDVRKDAPGKADGELKEATASVFNESHATVSSGTSETASL